MERFIAYEKTIIEKNGLRLVYDGCNLNYQLFKNDNLIASTTSFHFIVKEYINQLNN